MVKEPFQESDLRASSDAVLDTVRNIQRAINDADALKKFLLDRGFTWESAATGFADALERDPPSAAGSPGRVMRSEKTKAAKRRTGSRSKTRPNRLRKELSEQISETPSSLNQYSILDMVGAAGLTAFYPSRNYYHIYRAANTIDAYVSTAERSVVMVSINLMTGIPFDGLCEALERKLRDIPRFSVVISLLNPKKLWLMQALAPVLDVEPEALSRGIIETLKRLWNLRNGLPDSVKPRFSIRVHSAIPFGSAILLDHSDSKGRIQIETKVYKVAIRKSFAFEVGPSGASGLYNTLVSGYLNLISEGDEVSTNFLA
jgi:hypothetical protein